MAIRSRTAFKGTGTGAINNASTGLGQTGAGSISPSEVAAILRDIVDSAMFGESISGASGVINIDATTQDAGGGRTITISIPNGAINAGRLGNNAVTASKIANGAVNGGKIANNAVTNAKIANDAINQAKIADNAVGNDQIIDGSISLGSLQTSVSSRLPSTAQISKLAADDIRSITGISISGQTLTITWVDGSGTTQTDDATLPSGGQQPTGQTHAIYVSIAPNNAAFSPTAADFTAAGRSATVSSGTTITTPNWTTGDPTRHIAFAVPSDREITGIGYVGATFANNITAWIKQSGTVTIASATYDVWVSRFALNLRNTQFTITTEAG